MKVWLFQPFFKCVKKKKNQTACQTPECNPKEDNDAFSSVLNRYKCTNYQHHLKTKQHKKM